MNRIKRCPCCGCKANLKYREVVNEICGFYTSWHYVQCGNENCGLRTQEHTRADWALEIWNCRKSS